MDRFDVAIIGAGVSGAAIARRLSQYEISVVVLEKEADVSFGTSKANSGIIHGGFHHNKSFLKARLELRGADMFPQLHRELGFPYKQCGIVVAAITQDQQVTVEHLYRQGVENGSIGIELCGSERLRDLEPKLHPDVVGGLYAPSGGIIEPYRFVFALIENARANGVEIATEFKVTAAKRSSITDDFVISSTNGQRLKSRFVVNAAGLYADEISSMFSAETYKISARKGEYHLLDRRTDAAPSRVVFPVPTTISKGMLVIPTVEGTVLIGPTADPVEDKQDTGTTDLQMKEIKLSAQQLIPLVSEQDIIASFAGLRPTLPSGDFCVEESKIVPGFIQVVGIQSPGLTASPAIGDHVKELLKASGCKLTETSSFSASMEPVKRTRTKSALEMQDAWQTDPDAGEIVCRCETVTRKEVVEAIEAGHTTIDGIKFYCRATAGRCQGSFCTPRIISIVSEITGVPMNEVSKRGGSSRMLGDPLPGTKPYPRKGHTYDRDGPKGQHRSNMHLRLRPKRAAPESVDLIVLGGGAAGMAVASEVSAAGFETVILDREEQLGGVLRQCVHDGFGIHEFREELTGPEYADRYVSEISDGNIPVLTSTTVLGIDQEHDRFGARILSKERGLETINGRAVELAMGSRERNRGSLRIPGSRPSGILTAGEAQRFVNVDGIAPGKKAIIIGSGDIGLIMARRMKYVGAEVAAVVEIQPVPSGINRNIVQCLTDFKIPLFLGHVVTRIHGSDRVEGVTISPLINGVPDLNESFDLECDTLLLSVGLIPENEISREMGILLDKQTNGPHVDSRLMTNIPGVFASGNVLHIHDIVDYVAEESRRAGRGIVDFLNGNVVSREIELSAGPNVRYVTPGRARIDGMNHLYLRSYIAKLDANVEVRCGGQIVKSYRHQHIQPSEMIRIKLAGDQIDPKGGKLEVAIV